MDDRQYYVICADGCKFESMTKEQIYAAIEQAISTGEIKDVDTGFVTKLKECNRNAALSFWVGTQEEYNALTETAQNCFYIITDDTSGEDFEAAFAEMKETVDTLTKSVDEVKKTLWNVLFADSDGALAVGNNVPQISNYNMIVANVGNRNKGVFCGYVVLCDVNGAGNFSGKGMFFDSIRNETGRCDIALYVDKTSDTIKYLTCLAYGSSVIDNMEIMELCGVA